MEETTLVNVKVSHIRPMYQNLREWMNDESNVYIGRMGCVFIDGARYPKQASIWANPFKCPRDGSLEEVLVKYERHIKHLIATQPEIYKLSHLRGKRLGCWCYPAPCHGAVLIKLLE